MQSICIFMQNVAIKSAKEWARNETSDHRPEKMASFFGGLKMVETQSP